MHIRNHASDKKIDEKGKMSLNYQLLENQKVRQVLYYLVFKNKPQQYE